MRKIVLTFGLIGGTLLSIMMFMTLPFMDKIGFDKGMFVGYTTMVLAFLMVYFGIRSYRDNLAGGTVTFGRAFKVGALISLVTMSCYVATWQYIYHRITPDFMDAYTEYSLNKRRAAGASEADLVKMEADMKKFAEAYKNPLVNIGFTFLEPLPIALLATLISAGALSRRKRGAPGMATEGMRA